MRTDIAEDVTVDISDEHDDGRRMAATEADADIEIDENVSLLYRGSAEGFWKCVTTWSETVVEGLFPYYNLLAATSDMFAMRSAIDAPEGDAMPEGIDFNRMAGHLSEAGHGTLTLHGWPTTLCDLLPFRVSFAYPRMEVVTCDIPAMDWFVTVMTGGTDDLWGTEQPYAEVHEFIPDTAWETDVLAPEPQVMVK